MYKYTKDGISVLSILDTRRAKQNGLFPVKIQVVYKRTQRYYPTGKELSSENWEKLPTAKSRTLKEISDEISSSFDTIKGYIQELISKGDFSFESLNNRMGRGPITTLNSSFRHRISDLQEEERIGNMLWYANVLKSINRFSRTEIPIETVTVRWLKSYELFLNNESKSHATISMHFRAIRAIMNKAMKEGTLREAHYPFGKDKFEIQASEGRKIALTIKQIEQIACYTDISEASHKYRDLWFFIYLCNGINVADLVKLKYSNIVNGEIYFVRQKTERTSKIRKEICVIVTPEMADIINRWGNKPNPDNFIFPMLDGRESAMELKKKTQNITRSINRSMRMIGTKLGIGNISTYTARHSFATVLKRSGATIAYISESLGHNDMKTTENYLANFEKEERQKNAKLLTKFKPPKSTK